MDGDVWMLKVDVVWNGVVNLALLTTWKESDG